MGVCPGLYMYDVVVKSSRSLSHLLMTSCLCMSTDGQGTKCRRNIAENFNRLSYRRQTVGRAIANSEREREFTNKSSAVDGRPWPQ